MRIGVIPHLNYPIKPPFKGGLERFTYTFVESLAKAGHEPNLFFADALGDDNEERKAEVYHNIFDYIENNSHDFDVIHNHSLNKVAVERGAKLKLPYITTIHTPPFQSLKEAYLHTPNNDHTYYTVVSHSCYKEWKDILPGTNHRVIYNGVDLTEWTYQHTSQAETALYFGRIHRDKAPHLAIQAALKAGFRIRIAGPISDKDYYIHCIQPLLKADKAVYLGLLQGVQLVELVGSSSVLVNSPRWEEPLGLVLLESLASGTPIASFNRGAIKEIVTDTTGVICEEDTVEDLAAAIKDAARLNRAWCRHRVETNFSLDGMIKEYIKLYKEVCPPSTSISQPSSSTSQLMEVI